MILAIFEQFHDNELAQYIVDTNRLQPTDKLESLILKEIKKKKRVLWLEVDGMEKEIEDGGINAKAIIKDNAKFTMPIDKVLYLNIVYDC